MLNVTKTIKMATRLGLLLAISVAAGCAAPNPRKGETLCRVFGRMTSCAAVPLASVAADRAAKTLGAPPAEMGRLYLMRPYKQEWTKQTRVYLDGGLVAALGPATYAVLDVRSGTHRIVFESEERVELPAVIDAGKLYFGLYQARLWLWQFERSARWVSPDDAESALKRSRLVQLAGVASPR